MKTKKNFFINFNTSKSKTIPCKIVQRFALEQFKLWNCFFSHVKIWKKYFNFTNLVEHFWWGILFQNDRIMLHNYTFLHTTHCRNHKLKTKTLKTGKPKKTRELPPGTWCRVLQTIKHILFSWLYPLHVWSKFRKQD